MTIAPPTGAPFAIKACDSSNSDFSSLDCFVSSPGEILWECDLRLRRFLQYQRPYMFLQGTKKIRMLRMLLLL